MTSAWIDSFRPAPLMAAALLALALAGCGGEDAQRVADPEDDGAAEEVTFQYTVMGLLDTSPSFVVTVAHPDVGVEQYELALDQNGTFSSESLPCQGECPLWGDGRFPDTAIYRVIIAEDPLQECRLQTAPIAPVTTPMVIDCTSQPIHYTITGLEVSGPEIEIAVSHQTVGIQAYVLPLVENGSFSSEDLECAGECFNWSRGRFPPDTLYRVLIEDEPTQECRLLSPQTTLVSTRLELDCSTAPLQYAVSGLEGSGGNVLLTVSNPDLGVQGFYIPLLSNGSFTTEGLSCAGPCYHFPRGRVPPNSLYRAHLFENPANPDQLCRLSPSSPAPISTPLQIECGGATIGGAVTGLLGSGLEAGLAVEVEISGNTQMLVVEHQPIAENGEFVFETEVPIGDRYRVSVSQQPTDPGQVCRVVRIVDEASGLFEVDGGSAYETYVEGVVEDDVTDIRVQCPGAMRELEFSEVLFERRSRSTALRHYYDDRPLYVEHKFNNNRSTPLGVRAGLELTPLFQQLIDPPGSDGAAYSNYSGLTYWTLTESPSGQVVFSRYDHPYAYATTLTNRWLLQKLSGEARFTLEITKAEMVGVDDVHALSVGEFSGTLSAQTSIVVGGHLLDSEFTRFFSAGGKMKLRAEGDLDNPGGLPIWTAVPLIPESVDHAIWDEEDFDLNPSAGMGSQAGRVATLKLREPILVEVDLSQVPIGAYVEIISDAETYAYNLFTQEGGAAAYFRDPGEVDAGEDPAGVRVIEFTGLALVGVEDPADSNIVRAGTGPAPSACSAGVQRSVLEFDADQYQVSETQDALALAPIRVLRGANAAGLVSARVSLNAGTATAGEDFLTDEQIVRFGDQSLVPRTLAPFVVDDAVDEPSETLTLTLHSPEGCADIGPRNTATITILASDPAAGGVSFVSDSFAVDESAGFATVSVHRTNGSAGTANVTVRSADGTGHEGVDYGAVAVQVVFQAGETAPRNVQIPIIDNAVQDGDRTVLLEITALDPEAVATPSTATLTIRDNDLPNRGLLQFDAASYAVDETSGTFTAFVTRTGGTSGAVSVTVTSTNSTATAPADFTAVDQVIHFIDGDMAPKPVVVTIIDDTEDEGDHAFELRLSAPTGGASVGAVASVPVVIRDNDGPPPPPPATPVLDLVGAIKALDFDWLPTAGASFYRLLMDPAGLGNYLPVGVDLSLATLSFSLPISVHLMDWANARFMLQACNSGGCADSAAVSAEDAMLAAIGFIKSSNSDGGQQVSSRIGDFFGYTVAVSADGRTLVASAQNEDSAAMLVNGDQADNSAQDSGAVYVFTNDENGWSQQAYIKASNTDPRDAFGAALAVSADGNTLVVGAPFESSSATGVNGDSANDSAPGAGAVYVYQRSNGLWTLQAYLKASNTDVEDNFGASVALAGDGNTLVVGAPAESSAATGVGGDASDNAAADSGAAYLFTRAGTTWSQVAYVKASNTDSGDGFGSAVALSDDGLTLAIAARYEDSAATGIDGNQVDNSAPGSGHYLAGTGAVYVFRNGGGAWLQQAYVKSSNTDADDVFGRSLALSGDGALLVVGASGEDSIATGVNPGQQADDSAADAGAAYLFSFSGGVWQQQAYLKAANTRHGNAFGTAVEVSADGRYVVIGAPRETARGVGVDPDGTQSAGLTVGAAYLFSRDANTGDWIHSRYLKPTNSNLGASAFGRDLQFGTALSISGDGGVLAVGAYNDGSDARGIGGDQANENALHSGAIYLY